MRQPLTVKHTKFALMKGGNKKEYWKSLRIRGAKNTIKKKKDRKGNIKNKVGTQGQ